MSDSTITLDFVGQIIRALQTEQRNLRSDVALLRFDIQRTREDLARFVTRDELRDVVQILIDRIGVTESLMEARFDQLSQQIQSIQRSADRPAPD